MADEYTIDLDFEFDRNSVEQWRGEIDAPYRFYFDGHLLPITPSSWNYEAKNQNETIHMFNGNEVSWIKRSGLPTWSFDFTISNPIQKVRSYEFEEGMRDPDAMKDYLTKLKDNKQTMEFVVTDGYRRNIVNERVTLEDWNVEQDSDNCNDYVFTVNLQKYNEWHNMEADIDLNHHLILAKYAKGWRT